MAVMRSGTQGCSGILDFRSGEDFLAARGLAKGKTANDARRSLSQAPRTYTSSVKDRATRTVYVQMREVFAKA